MTDPGVVCLIRPPAVETLRFSSLSVTPPLGLAYIAGALERAGARVQVIDAVASAPKTYRRYFHGYLMGLTFEEIAARIDPEASFVGITVVFTHEWPEIVKLVDAIKQRHPDMPVVLGGEHVTSMPAFSLRTSRADVLVLGEGEETVVELAGALARRESLQDIPGVAFRAKGSIVVNPRRARTLAVDDIAWPAWHLFDLDTYEANRWMGGMFSGTKTVPILATRGCPYQCTYCSAPNMWTPRWVPRQPSKVVDEIEHYVTEFGARNFPFQDLTAIVRREWIVEFCNELLNRGLDITWQMPTGTRSEAIDEEVAILLRKTGLISVAYAPESGSDETRQLIKKRMNGDRLFESMRVAIGAGLNVSVFLVIGFPHDTADHMRQTGAFVEELAKLGIVDIAIGFYMALPGTQLFDSLYAAGRLRLDRTYFRHILSATSVWATSTYCDELSAVELTRWKFALFRNFYGAKSSAGVGGGLSRQIRDAVLQLRRRSADESRLQTAFRNGVGSGLQTLRSQVRRGWVTRSEERRFFDGWDAICREVREREAEAKAAPTAPVDSREWKDVNVIKLIQTSHRQKWSLEVAER